MIDFRAGLNHSTLSNDEINIDDLMKAASMSSVGGGEFHIDDGFNIDDGLSLEDLGISGEHVLIILLLSIVTPYHTETRLGPKSRCLGHSTIVH